MVPQECKALPGGGKILSTASHRGTTRMAPYQPCAHVKPCLRAACRRTPSQRLDRGRLPRPCSTDAPSCRSAHLCTRKVWLHHACPAGGLCAQCWQAKQGPAAGLVLTSVNRTKLLARSFSQADLAWPLHFHSKAAHTAVHGLSGAHKSGAQAEVGHHCCLVHSRIPSRPQAIDVRPPACPTMSAADCPNYAYIVIFLSCACTCV